MKKTLTILLIVLLFITITNITIHANEINNDSTKNYPEQFKDYDQYINDPYYTKSNVTGNRATTKNNMNLAINAQSGYYIW